MSAQAEPNPPADQILKLRRVVKAPREAVFQAFVDPAQVQRWYGPRGFSATIDRFEARPGGAYRLCMVSPDGNAHWLRGAFLAVEPPARLAFTWIWEQGEMAGREMLVTISFEPAGEDGTEVNLVHSRLPSEAAAKAHEGGWLSSLDCLVDLFVQ